MSLKFSRQYLIQVLNHAEERLETDRQSYQKYHKAIIEYINYLLEGKLENE